MTPSPRPLGVIEIAPGDWRVRLVLDRAIEVVCDESFASREECIDPDQIGRVQ